MLIYYNTIILRRNNIDIKVHKFHNQKNDDIMVRFNIVDEVIRPSYLQQMVLILFCALLEKTEQM